MSSTGHVMSASRLDMFMIERFKTGLSVREGGTKMAQVGNMDHPVFCVINFCVINFLIRTCTYSSGQ